MEVHVPVLLNEVLENIVLTSSGNYFDGTLGFGGHSSKILEKLDDNSKLVATDKDIDAFNYCRDKFAGDDRVKIYNTDFDNIDFISKIEFVDSYNGILADLGVSSFQLDNKDSGFTFREDVKIDLRMNKKAGQPASDILNNFDEDELIKILRDYGEERKARQIVRKIIEYRKRKKLETTFELRDIIAELVPEFYLVKSLSRVFQALRIYVNDELNVLKEFLGKSVDLLEKGGRIGIITFHSLEDRIVKDFFKYEALDCICPKEFPVCKCDKESRVKIITRKPIISGKEEVSRNKRSRSAKLRVAERI